jgi:hypothetical protein
MAERTSTLRPLSGRGQSQDCLPGDARLPAFPRALAQVGAGLAHGVLAEVEDRGRQHGVGAASGHALAPIETGAVIEKIWVALHLPADVPELHPARPPPTTERAAREEDW